MDEEAVKTMYTLAQSQGYQDSQADFEQLLGTDTKALGTMYGLAQDNGYAEDLESFEILMGLKKKEEPVVTESVSDAGSSEQRIAARQPEQESYAARVRGLTGQRLAPTPYETPAEQAKRDSATTAIETREARIAENQIGQRQEEAPEPLPDRGQQVRSRRRQRRALRGLHRRGMDGEVQTGDREARCRSGQRGLHRDSRHVP